MLTRIHITSSIFNNTPTFFLQYFQKSTPGTNTPNRGNKQDARAKAKTMPCSFQSNSALFTGLSSSSSTVFFSADSGIKIVSVENEAGEMINTIKLSNNAEKVSTPGKKQVWRITSREKGKSEGDYITYDGVDVSQLTELKMFHPTYTYINKTVRNFEAVPLLVDIFKEGQLVYQLPTLSEIQEYARKNYDQLWDEYKRVLNPQHYPVDLAKDIWQDKMDLIEEMRNKANGEGDAK